MAERPLDDIAEDDEEDETIDFTGHSGPQEAIQMKKLASSFDPEITPLPGDSADRGGLQHSSSEEYTSSSSSNANNMNRSRSVKYRDPRRARSIMEKRRPSVVLSTIWDPAFFNEDGTNIQTDNSDNTYLGLLTVFDRFTSTPEMKYWGTFFLLMMRIVFYVGSVGVYFAISEYDDHLEHQDHSYKLWRLRKSFALLSLEIVTTALTVFDSLIMVFVVRDRTFSKRLFTFDNFLNFSLAGLVIWDVIEGDIFVPLFLHIWTVSNVVGALVTLKASQGKASRDDQQRYTILVVKLLMIVVSIIVTAMCGIEHLEKASHIDGTALGDNLFVSFYFTMVTLSTVGYGDMTPVTTLGRLFVIGIIVSAIVVIPQKVNQLSSLRDSMKARGGSYDGGHINGHVVFVVDFITLTSLRDFLMEMVNSKIKPPFVVMLSSEAIPDEVTEFIQNPFYYHRVKAIVGSVFSSHDLARAKIKTAEACFIMSERFGNEEEADRSTILRAWAVHDKYPDVALYIHLNLNESAVHVPFAKAVTVYEEIRSAMLATSALVPRFSTVLVQLLHSSQFSANFSDAMMMTYHKSCLNQIWSARLSETPFFEQYIGMPFFTVAAKLIQQGICLLGVKPLSSDSAEKIIFFPVDPFILSRSNTVYYISPIDLSFLLSGPDTEGIEGMPSSSLNDDLPSPPPSSRYPEKPLYAEPRKSVTLNDHFRRLFFDIRTFAEPTLVEHDVHQEKAANKEEGHAEKDQDGGTKQFLLQEPIMPIIRQEGIPSLVIDTMATYQCHVVGHFADRSDSSSFCPLPLRTDSMLLTDDNVKEVPRSVFVVMSGECKESNIFHFIRNLRSAHIDPEGLLPIIFNFPAPPSPRLLQIMNVFPDIHYFVCDFARPTFVFLTCLRLARTVLVSSSITLDGGSTKESSRFTDAKAIFAIQSILHAHPNVHIFCELSRRSNLKFLKKSTTKIPFHHEFDNFVYYEAVKDGSAWSTNVLDSLLYQCFLPHKEDLVQVFRNFLGVVDPSLGSSLLYSFELSHGIMKQHKINTYGDLAGFLMSKRQQLPVGMCIRRKDAHSLDRPLGRRDSNTTLYGPIMPEPSDDMLVMANPDPFTIVYPGSIIYILRQPHVWDSPILGGGDSPRKETIVQKLARGFKRKSTEQITREAFNLWKRKSSLKSLQSPTSSIADNKGKSVVQFVDPKEAELRANGSSQSLKLTENISQHHSDV